MKRTSLMLITYWVLFWLFNGIDKFLNKTDLSFFAWHGKDRHNQFSDYFSNMKISEDWIDPILFSTGILEIMIATVLTYGLWHSKKGWLFCEVGSLLGGVMLIAFSVFDVVAGDRAELLEHSIYIVLLAVTLIVIDKSQNEL